MHTVGPYRLLRALNSCEVGGTWSGVDDAGRPVTIAVLNERASADQRWRDAFAAAADTLAEAGADQLPIVASDHRTANPWVACAVERGPGAAQIFAALGQRLQSVPQQEAVPEQQAVRAVPEQRVAAQPVSPVAQAAAQSVGQPVAQGSGHGAGTGAGPAAVPPRRAVGFRTR